MIDYNYEHQLEYLADMVESPHSCNWLGACEHLNSQQHPDSIRKAFACTKYGGYAVYKYFKQKQTSEVMTSEELKKMEMLRDKLYKERVRYSDKIREYNAKLRSDARFENLKETMIEELQSYPKIQICPATAYSADINSEAALLISDIHLGLEINTQFNRHNIHEVESKLNTLVEKTIKYCKLHNVNKLYIELLGDLVSGIIQITSRCEQEEDVISQVLKIGELLSKAICSLATHVPNIEVLGVHGNHGRVTPDKKANLEMENFERLVFAYIKTRIPDKIPVRTANNEDFLIHSIAGKKIVLTHGTNDSLSNAKQHYANLLKEHVDEIHMGHYHSFQITDDCDTEIVVNGTMMGTDKYAVQIRKHTKPSQTLRIYNLIDGDVCTYKITFN